jgi:hypothetical protein
MHDLSSSTVNLLLGYALGAATWPYVWRMLTIAFRRRRRVRRGYL